MSFVSNIEYIDTSWNVISGCTHAPRSRGCDHCYAERLASTRLVHLPQYAGLTRDGHWTGEIRFNESELEKPLHWKKPRRIFVNSMSDTFHENVQEEWLDRIFAVMALCPQHTFILLTKRPNRMRIYVKYSRAWWRIGCEVRELRGGISLGEIYRSGRGKWPLPNCWLGVSVENQQMADQRIPYLIECPAAVRWINMEPLLDSIRLRPEWTGWVCSLEGTVIGQTEAVINFDNVVMTKMQRQLSWVVVGAESGPNARPCKLDWIRSIRDQCVVAGIPLFVKQARREGLLVKMPHVDGKVWAEYPKVQNGLQA